MKTLATLCLLASLTFPAVLHAQQPASGGAQDVENLRRDQEEILRKAERLQALMERLAQRYEREGRKEQGHCCGRASSTCSSPA